MSNTSLPIYVKGPNTLVMHMAQPFQYLLGVLNGLPGMIWDAQYELQHGVSDLWVSGHGLLLK